MSPVPPAIRDHTLGPSVCNVHPHLPECPALVSVTSDSALRLNFTDGLNPDINPKTVAGAGLSPPQTQEAFGLEVASGPVCPALTPELVSTTTRTLPPGRTQSRANQVHTGKSCLFTFCLRTGTAGEESPPTPALPIVHPPAPAIIPGTARDTRTGGATQAGTPVPRRHRSLTLGLSGQALP